MQTSGRKRLLTVSLSGALALGLVGASGIALAQSPTGGDGPPPATEGHRPHRPALKGLVAIFKASGLDRAVFAEGFQQGMTVGEVLEANGVDPQAVIAQVLAQLEERLNQAVEDGKIDAARVPGLLAKAEEGLNELMDFTPPPPGDRHGPGDRPHRRAVLEIAAATIGIPVEDLRETLKGGATLAEVAEANGSSAQAVIDALLQPVFDRIDQALADGRIDEATAQQKKDEATARVTGIVNNGPQQPPPAS
jgi:hypothetical protein